MFVNIGFVVFIYCLGKIQETILKPSKSFPSLYDRRAWFSPICYLFEIWFDY